jgi:hypothetical protein
MSFRRALSCEKSFDSTFGRSSHDGVRRRALVSSWGIRVLANANGRSQGDASVSNGFCDPLPDPRFLDFMSSRPAFFRIYLERARGFPSPVTMGKCAWDEVIARNGSSFERIMQQWSETLSWRVYAF